MNNNRNSNFELLRIIAIVMITAYHYVVHGATDMAITSGGGSIFLNICSLWGKAGVNIFCLLTGFMLVRKENISYGKLKTVEAQILFYTLLGLIVGFIFGNHIGLGALTKTIMPVVFGHYWYMTAYVIVFLLSPYINILIKNIDKDSFWELLLICYVVWSIIPFITVREHTGMYWSQFIWFVVMYMTGAYIRIVPARFSKRFYVNTLWLSNIGLILSVVALSILSLKYEVIVPYIPYFRWSNSPFVIAICISMMRLADIVPAKSVSWINFLSSLVLGIYLFQENIFFQDICWNDWFNNSIPSSILQGIVHIIVSVAGVCIIGGTIDYLRSKIFKLLRLS